MKGTIMTMSAAFLLRAHRPSVDSDSEFRFILVVLASWKLTDEYDFGRHTIIHFSPLSEGQKGAVQMKSNGKRITEIHVRQDFLLSPSENDRKQIRGVAVLERINTPEGIAVLRNMASGDDDLLQTIEAKAALKRLNGK
jgi:hypothetical protein